MRCFFLTLDLEEWYHLEYLKAYECDRSIRVAQHLDTFLSMLEAYEINMTVFVVSELVREYKSLILEIAAMGHEIATHGPDHRLVSQQSPGEFREGIIRAKEDLECVLGTAIRGYRAPCYSLDEEKLSLLQECGFSYDSSYIRFPQHPLYGSLALAGFSKVEDLVYEKDGFFEFEIPTLRVLGMRIPISGGGYFRLFPMTLYRLLVRKHNSKSSNFLFYVHPFELTNYPVPLPAGASMIDRFRFSVGRASALARLETFLKEHKEKGYTFLTCQQFIERARGQA